MKAWFELLGVPETEEGSEASIIEFRELVYLFRGRYTSSYENARNTAIIEEIKNKPFLIIDDIGTEKQTAYVDEVLFDVVNHRYVNKLQTLFTSNLSLDNLAKRYDLRVSSRILEMCGLERVVKMEPINHRMEKPEPITLEQTAAYKRYNQKEVEEVQAEYIPLTEEQKLARKDMIKSVNEKLANLGDRFSMQKLLAQEEPFELELT